MEHARLSRPANIITVRLTSVGMGTATSNVTMFFVQEGGEPIEKVQALMESLTKKFGLVMMWQGFTTTQSCVHQESIEKVHSSDPTK